MPVIINAQSNVQTVAELFAKYADTFPRDIALALTRTAKLAKTELVNVVGDYIDNPTPFTKRGFFYKGATANKGQTSRTTSFMSAEVGTEEPTDYYRQFHHLKAQVFGGDRAIRGSERRLRALGMLSGSEYLAPGPAMHLDQYGNMPGPKVLQLLSQIRANSIKGESGYEGNRAEGSKSLAFFALINGQKGIWERRGRRNIRLMISAIQKPSYTPKFPMVQIVEGVFNTKFEEEFWKAFKQGEAHRAKKGL